MLSPKQAAQPNPSNPALCRQDTTSPWSTAHGGNIFCQTPIQMLEKKKKKKSKKEKEKGGKTGGKKRKTGLNGVYTQHSSRDGPKKCFFFEMLREIVTKLRLFLNQILSSRQKEKRKKEKKERKEKKTKRKNEKDRERNEEQDPRKLKRKKEKEKGGKKGRKKGKVVSKRYPSTSRKIF